MYFISATRLRVKSVIYLPSFFIANEKSVKALLASSCFAGGKELIDKHFTFWTLTCWQDMNAMKNFRNGAVHRKVMQKLPLWCDEASYVHWEQDTNALPDWQTVYDRMMNEGKQTKVRNPSPQQVAKTYTPIKWRKLERPFKPALV